MKRKYAAIGITFALWLISVLLPLFGVVFKRVPQQVLTAQLLVILLISAVICLQWFWLRKAERQQLVSAKGDIEGTGMNALQSMTIPMLFAAHTGEILWYNTAFSARFLQSRSALGRTVQDVIHLNLAALDQNRDLLMEHNGPSYGVMPHRIFRINRKLLRYSSWKSQIFCGCKMKIPILVPVCCCW